jgi:hypothetical protein
MSRESGICEARKAHERLVSDIRAGKYGEKVTPDKIRTLGQPLDEWIDHGETRGRRPTPATDTGSTPRVCQTRHSRSIIRWRISSDWSSGNA